MAYYMCLSKQIEKFRVYTCLLRTTFVRESCPFKITTSVQPMSLCELWISLGIIFNINK